MPFDQDHITKALHAMAERLDHVLWVTDAAAERVLYVNDAYERVFGRPKSWVLERPLRESTAVHPEDRERLSAQLAATDHQDLATEYRIVRPDGEVRWLEGRGFSVSGGDRRVIVGIARDVTEERRSARALRESEERLRELAESLPHIVFRVRTVEPWGIEYVNRAIEHLLGVTPEEICADRDLLPSMAHESDRGHLLDRLSGRAPADLAITRYRHRDGRDVWLEAQGLAVHDAEGRQVAYHGIARDVTDRVRNADLTLRLDVTRILSESPTLSEAAPKLLEAIATRAGWVVAQLWLADLEGGAARWRAEWHAAEQPVDALTSWSRSVTPAPGEGPIGQVLLTSQALWESELGSGADPLSIAAVASGLKSMLIKPIRGVRGVLGVLCCFSDMPRPRRPEELAALAGAASEIGQFVSRERAEVALQEARSTLATVFAHVPGMAYRARPTRSRELEVASDGALGLTGYPASALAQPGGMSLGDLVAEHDRDAVWADISRAVAAGRPFQCEYRLHGADGKERWVLDHGTGNLDASGRLVAIQGFITDITSRRKLEEQLHQAQKMEAVGQLAGGVAHDFNNMLMAMTFAADFLHEGLRAGDPLHADVEEIRRAIDRAAGLTRQLLAFSRKQVMRPEVISLNDVVSRMGTMLRRVIGEDIEIQTSLDPELAHVKADPGQIEQVLLNLALNARDAMPGGGRLTIETHNATLDEDGREERYASVVVSDSGTGMDEATRARVFEPFFTTKGVGRGTGLGLASVYGIIKQSGGHIRVYSEPGRGAAFRVYLPSTAEPPAASDSAAKESPGSGNETVLLVEDEDPVRAAARRVLQQHGYVVLEARGPGEAMLLSERFSGTIHLLLSDVVMPGMSGPDLAERLVERRPDLTVLFMSGFTEHAAITSGMLSPSSAFLEKPFSPSVLATRVRELLDRRGRSLRS